MNVCWVCVFKKRCDQVVVLWKIIASRLTTINSFYAQLKLETFRAFFLALKSGGKLYIFGPKLLQVLLIKEWLLLMLMLFSLSLSRLCSFREILCGIKFLLKENFIFGENFLVSTKKNGSLKELKKDKLLGQSKTISISFN